MTDLGKFIELYRSFGIGCEVRRIIMHLGYEVILKCGSGSEDGVTFSSKFDGYPEFYTIIKFDEKGKFYSQGFWSEEC